MSRNKYLQRKWWLANIIISAAIRLVVPNISRLRHAIYSMNKGANQQLLVTIQQNQAKKHHSR